jgi:hypothetical protein
MYELKKKLERKVNLLRPYPRLIKKEYTGPRSHKRWETMCCCTVWFIWCIPALNGRSFGSCNILMQRSYIYSENSQQWLGNTRAGTLTGDIHHTEQNNDHNNWNFTSVKFGFKCFSPVPYTLWECSCWTWPAQLCIPLTEGQFFFSVGETFFLHCSVQRGLLGCGLVGITDIILLSLFFNHQSTRYSINLCAGWLGV